MTNGSCRRTQLLMVPSARPLLWLACNAAIRILWGKLRRNARCLKRSKRSREIRWLGEKELQAVSLAEALENSSSLL